LRQTLICLRPNLEGFGEFASCVCPSIHLPVKYSKMIAHAVKSRSLALGPTVMNRLPHQSLVNGAQADEDVYNP
jgi:hypothetical protein